VSENEISNEIKLLAKKYNVNVMRNEKARNNNGYVCGDYIHLGNFDKPNLELAAFFHELGHFLRNQILNSNRSVCKLSNESLAWEIALAKAKEEGYEWDFYGEELNYARKCLKSFVNSNENHIGPYYNTCSKEKEI